MTWSAPVNDTSAIVAVSGESGAQVLKEAGAVINL